MEDYRDVNRASWDERVPAHVASAGYQVGRFTHDSGLLSEVVRFDRPRLGDLSGVCGVHLQCHIGGRPMLWALGEPRPEPTVFETDGSYVETDTRFENTVTREWNHGLGELITALMDAGLELTGLTEHDSVPWQLFPGQMVQSADGEWRLADRPWRLAASYTLQAVKRR